MADRFLPCQMFEEVVGVNVVDCSVSEWKVAGEVRIQVRPASFAQLNGRSPKVDVDPARQKDAPTTAVEAA
jgi:hypothetical protein